MSNKKKLGIILSVVFTLIGLGVLVYISNWQYVALSLLLTFVIWVAVSICVYLLND